MLLSCPILLPATAPAVAKKLRNIPIYHRTMAAQRARVLVAPANAMI
jgi:hypothetical protein